MSKIDRTLDPKFIFLPDGERYDVNELLRLSCKKYKVHRLNHNFEYEYLQRAIAPNAETAETRNEKYQRLVDSSIPQICKEQNVDEVSAWNKIRYAHKMLGMENPSIYDFR